MEDMTRDAAGVVEVKDGVDALTFEDVRGSGYVQVRACRYSADAVTATIAREDAIVWLRACLRQLAGPSIDDVREAWGLSPEQCYCAHTDYAPCGQRWYVWIGAGEPLWIHRATEAEALSAAYDAAPTMEVG